MENKTPWYMRKVGRRETISTIAHPIIVILLFVLLAKLGIIRFISGLPLGDIFLMVTGTLIWLITGLVFNKLIGKGK